MAGRLLGRVACALTHVNHSQPCRSVAQLAQRPFMPGGESPNFPKTLQDPREGFPITVTAESVGITDKATATECARAVAGDLEGQLMQSGAVLFRGFPLKDADDFSTFFDGFGIYKSMDYKGGAAVRDEVVQNKNVFTASREPPEWNIEPHNEMAYLEYWPRLIIFYCDLPAATGAGGETVIVDVRDIYKHLDRSITDKFEKLGITYHHHVADKSKKFYQSWQEVFYTEDRAEVEEHMKSHGESYEWHDDGSISFWRVRPAFTNHPKTGEKLWFNHAHRKHASAWKTHPVWMKLWKEHNLTDKMFPTHSFYGDGTEFEDGVINHIRDISWREAVGYQMQKGDVVVLENHFVQHARLSFTGQRKLLTILAADK